MLSFISISLRLHLLETPSLKSDKVVNYLQVTWSVKRLAERCVTIRYRSTYLFCFPSRSYGVTIESIPLRELHYTVRNYVGPSTAIHISCDTKT